MTSVSKTGQTGQGTHFWLKSPKKKRRAFPPCSLGACQRKTDAKIRVEIAGLRGRTQKDERSTQQPVARRKQGSARGGGQGGRGQAHKALAKFGAKVIDYIRRGKFGANFKFQISNFKFQISNLKSFIIILLFLLLGGRNGGWGPTA